MVRLSLNNVLCYVDGPEEILGLVQKALTWTVKGAFFSPAYQAKHWDGKKSLYYKRYDAFPAGLVKYITDKFKREGIEYEIQWIGPDYPPIELKTPKLDIEDRDYQEGTFEAFLKTKRGIAKLSTRSGKTTIAIKCATALDVPTLFIVHTKALFDQTITQWKMKTGTEPGKIGDGVWKPKKFTIALIQSLHSKQKRDKQLFQDYLFTIRFLIIDEVHRTTKSYLDVGHACKNADWRLGLSATPLMSGKGNKLMSMSLTGPMFYEVGMAELIEKGVIVKPKIYFISTDFKNEAYDFADAYDAGIVSNEQRNLMIAICAKKIINKGKAVLILVEKKKHIENLMKIFNETPYRCTSVTGRDKTDVRDEAKLKIQDGSLDILITTRIFDEGIDLPALSAVIIASGYKSPTKIYQQGGRPVTKFDGKDYAIVVDFLDYGHPDLNEHSQKRVALCRKEKAFEVHFTNIDEFSPFPEIKNEES